MRERIKGVMSSVFSMPAGDIPDEASIEVVQDWDSLRHLELMLGIEMEFGVRISSEAMPDLLSISAIEEYLRENGAAVSA